MRELCLEFPSDCFLNEMTAHESASAPPDWTIPLSSTYCLMPLGDLPTRKAFFDALLMGCIPVTCSHLSAHEQWNWNLGLEYALSMTHYLPCKRIMQQQQQSQQNQTNFLHELIQLHREHDEVVMKRFIIAQYASRLQYRLPEGEYRDTPFRYRPRSPSPSSPPDAMRGGQQRDELTPPVDAFDIVIDRLLNEIEDLEDMVSNPRDRGDWRGQEVFSKYPLGRTVTNLTHGVVPCLIVCK
jgi:hypothetical protein